MTQSSTGKLVIGLTGGIGAGKSMVAGRLEELGAKVIDADQTGHQVLRRPEVKARLRDAFGADIFGDDGEIDRSRLAAHVFSNAELRKQLEAIVHPVMAEMFREQLTTWYDDAEVSAIVLDAAILMETGWHTICNRIMFVDAPRSVRLQRLTQSRGWPAEELDRREAAQWPVEEKKARADIVIDNSGPMSETWRQVDRIFHEWTAPDKDAARGLRDSSRPAVIQ